MARISDFDNDYLGLDDARADDNIDLYGYNSDTKLDEQDKGYSPVRAFLNLRFLIMLAAAVLSLWYGVVSDSDDGGLPQMITGGLMLLLCGGFAAEEIAKNTYCDRYFFEMKTRSKVEFRVMRNSELTYIRRELIVPDDILYLQAGESVPADAHLLEIRGLTVDESVFTGDKTPVSKFTGADSEREELKKSCIYKGSKIVSGELVARVTGTGVDTRYFKEFGAVHASDEYYTTFERLIMRVSGIFSAVAAVMLFIGAFSFITVSVDIPFIDTIYNTFYPAAAFALCFIPAETASLVRLYYIRGAQKLEEKGIWIKNLRTIEHINAATCILIDKNGMVTKKNMQFADQLTQNPAMLANISVLACSKTPDSPFDKAIILNASFNGRDTSELTNNELVREYVFDEEEGGAGNLWIVGGAKLLCIKGAPEKLLPLCDVPNDMLYTVQNKQVSYSQQGYNVLAVAYARIPDDMEPPERISEAHYSFMGLIAFETQTKDYIPAAILGCRKAGARVVMTTGDSAETALAVANKVGIRGDKAVTGDMLRSGEDIDLSGVGVFARITDGQKRDIIRREQENGEVVMITGETAADSDLLELADIGVSIASTVSGAAFEEADVVVNNDSFETVTDIMSVSRQAHLNIKRCISTSLTALGALIIFAVFDLIMGGEPIVTPVISSLLAVLFVPAAGFMFYENVSDLRRFTEPSHYISSGHIRKGFFVRPLIQSAGIALAEIIYYLISSGGEASADYIASSRSGFLMVFVCGLLLTCVSNLSDAGITESLRSARGLPLLIAGVSLAAVLVLIYVPVVNSLFGLAAPEIMSLIIALLITVILQLPAELLRMSLSKLKESKEL